MITVKIGKAKVKKKPVVEKSRRTYISMSFLIMQLYGTDDYYSFKNYQDIKLVRKYYLKILDTLKYAVYDNLNITDDSHIKEAIERINYAKKTLALTKDFYSIDQAMIAFLTEFAFLLFGYVPTRWQSKRVINKKGNWKLDSHRSISYSQSIEQKKNIIFHAAQGKYKSRFGTWGDFVLKVYHTQCSNKPEKLIKWIKENHPDMYIDLF